MSDPAKSRLGVARIALGALFLVRTTPLANRLGIPLTHVDGPLLGWPSGGEPMAWADLVLPDTIRKGACVVRTISAVLFALGVRARPAGLIAGGLGLLAMSQDPFDFTFTVYTLFVATMVMAMTDAAHDRALVPDHLLDRRSSVRLLRAFLASIYAFSAIAKLNTQWLNGTVLLTYARDRIFTPRAAALLEAHPSLCVAAAWAAVLLEFGLAAGLLIPVRRAFPIATLVAITLHLTFEVVARPDLIGWIMATLLLGATTPSNPATVAPEQNSVCR